MAFPHKTHLFVKGCIFPRNKKTHRTMLNPSRVFRVIRFARNGEFERSIRFISARGERRVSKYAKHSAERASVVGFAKTSVL